MKRLVYIYIILLNQMSTRPRLTTSKWGYPKDAPQEVEKPRTTQLCDACCFGDLQTVCKLMEDQSLDVNLSDRFGHTPLYFACSNNQFSVVEKLLKHSNLDVNRKIEVNYSFGCAFYSTLRVARVIYMLFASSYQAKSLMLTPETVMN